MIRRISIAIIMAVIALFAVTEDVSAQVYTRDNTRGNIRTINNGGLVPIDSAAILKAKAEAAARRDSLYYNHLDSIGRTANEFYDNLPDTARDSMRSAIAAMLKRDSSIRGRGDSIAPDGRRVRLNKNGEPRKPFISDSMGLSKMCWLSLPLPGFGQIYNKQYWKLGVLYPVVGTSLGMFIHENKQYKPLKAQYDRYLIDHGYMRTPELDAIQTEMIRHNTRQQIYAGVAIATYLYFIGDAAVNYSTNEVSQVKKATTLSTICPGAGQIYNKSYWKVPFVIGGFATLGYCIDWNNRGSQRFKKAYRLKADFDANPDLYPNGSQDEFGGRYNTSFLKNLRNSYRRNRDLCIILTAGLYILQIVDAHVDAHLRSYDISKDLSVSLSPVIGYSYNRMAPYSGGGATLGMNLSLRF